MKTRWIICLILSLAVHAGWLFYQNIKTSQAPDQSLAQSLAKIQLLMQTIQQQAEPPAPIESNAPEEPTQAQNEPQPELTPEMDTVIPEELKFKPNLEEGALAENETELPQPIEPESESVASQPESLQPAAEELVDRIPAETIRPQTNDNPEEHQVFRRRLLQDMDENWQSIPDLNTKIPDLVQLPDIDRHFGIVLMAYCFKDHKPSAPFLVFDRESGAFVPNDTLDFSRFSNRMKERSLTPDQQQQLQCRKEASQITSLTKTVRLDPGRNRPLFRRKTDRRHPPGRCITRQSRRHQRPLRTKLLRRLQPYHRYRAYDRWSINPCPG